MTVLVVLVLSVLLAVALSQQLTRPIISLTNTAQEISAGKFDIQAPVNSGDEIGILAQTFNMMTGQLKVLFKTWTTAPEKWNNKLRNLKSQVSKVKNAPMNCKPLQRLPAIFPQKKI